MADSSLGHDESESGTPTEAEVTADAVEPAHTSAGQTRTEVPLAQTDPCAYWHQVRRLYGSSGAAIVGNILEWYDWTLYGYMEDILMQVFGISHTTAWTVFAIPFVVRPLGSVVFGCIGDRFGRAAALNLAIWGMTLATVLQGCVPAVPGATVALTALRVLSGLSAGGESAGVNTYMSEIGGAEGVHTLVAAVGVNNVSGPFAFFLANLAAILVHQLPPRAQVTWAWRLPFLAAAPVGLVSVMLRRRMCETEDFKRVRAARRRRSATAEDSEDSDALAKDREAHAGNGDLLQGPPRPETGDRDLGEGAEVVHTTARHPDTAPCRGQGCP